MRRVTLRDIATATGLDVSTVSRVLNRDPQVRIAPARRAEVVRVADELGYVPHRAARSLRLQRTHTVAFALQDLEFPLERARLYGVVDRLDRSGYIVSLLPDRQAEGAACPAAIRRQAPEGVLWHGWPAGDGVVEELRAMCVPLVVIDPFGAPQPPPSDVGVVRSDRAGGVRAALAHLAAAGHRRIALVSARTNVLRCEGYRTGVRDLGLEVDHRLERLFDHITEAENVVRSQGHRAVRELLRERVPFTAVQAGSDITAAGVIDALREAGLSVPGDVAVVGYDDLEAYHSLLFTRPFLTTLADPNHEMGSAAACLLLDMLESEAGSKEVVLQPTLVVRASA